MNKYTYNKLNLKAFLLLDVMLAEVATLLFKGYGFLKEGIKKLVY